ncbi:MAG: diaminopimelate decarboxylase [Pseudomonadota bacterium]|nr:diaminopimelate decarboxylase [Pseudomonadota bacterium]
MTSAFVYRAGSLCAEEVPLEAIAADVGTPCYVYSHAQLKANYKAFATAFEGAFAGQSPMICYAVKANTNQAVIRTLADCGAGADVTSVGEMERALAAGISPGKIIYSGVGKRRDEIMAALLAGVHQLNVESIVELHLISQVAVGLKKTAPLAIRINPDVTARTYKQTSTGELTTKFGIGLAQLEDAMKLATSLPFLEFRGFQVHIGSHVHDYEPFREAFVKLAEIVKYWRGKGVRVQHLDLGGGVGIPYDGQTLAPFAEYAAIVRQTLGDSGCEISFEPGRRLVGDAGVLVSRVTYDKQGIGKRFLILDAGMNDLIRPAMYGARHSILPLRENADRMEVSLADVVGPVCETSDLFGEDYSLPGVSAGDCLAILQAGAYGSAMSSTYNGRPLLPEIMVAGHDYAVVRRRISVDEQMSWEVLPPWIG